jgi:hypothetical protein
MQKQFFTVGQVKYVPEFTSRKGRIAGSPILKGQCHEMVAEIRPWSGRFGLN